MKEDCDQAHFPFSTIPYDTSSSLSCPTLQQDQRAIHREQLARQLYKQPLQEQEPNEPSVEKMLRGCETQEEHTPALPVKWMSSKMRLMRKMMGEDNQIVGSKQGCRDLQDQAQPNRYHCSSSSNGSNSPIGIVRVCSNCSTTKTPLWRSGPQGPKSLCNACGIRQMKARRAMRAAAAAAGGGLVPDSAPKKVTKKERSEVDRTVPFKKRFKVPTNSSAQKKLRFDNIAISSGKKLAFHQAFPQEEKDAAILLMALSCGLIYG